MIHRLATKAGIAAFLLGCASVAARAAEVASPPAAAPAAKASDSSYEKRLANARSVKVMTSVLGVGLDDDLETARAKLDPLSDPAQPPQEESAKGAGHGARRRKVLWRFADGDYAAIFIKTDTNNRIISIIATLREGREIPFEKIGELKKAPILSDTTVAWDVVRPNRPLSRVVVSGAGGKASTITWAVVKRRD